MKNNYFKYKDSIGLGVIEIILAVAIMMIITPAVLKYSFKELYEVKYINIAKQLKQIEKSLLNYASIEKRNWANGSSGKISNNVYNLFVSDYGLPDEINPDLRKDFRVSYKKDNDGLVNVFAVLNADALGLDEMAFKQTLLYAGDTAGYRDENYAYSITGAWSEPFMNITSNIDGENIVVIKIDDTNLENEYASSNYLYRNNQGGKDGNTMRVDLSLGGYSINNFGTIEAANLYSSSTDTQKIKELNFNNGQFEGVSYINNSVIVKGILTFVTNTYINTSKMEILDLVSNAEDSISILKEVKTPNGLLQNASSSSVSSFHANVIVEGIATLMNFALQNMQISTLSGYNEKLTNLSVKPREDSKLRLEIAANDVDDLKVQTITIKNGHIRSRSNVFNSSAGVMNVNKGSSVIIYDACNTPVSRTNYSGCDGKVLNKINFDNFFNKFSEGLSDLSVKINNMPAVPVLK